MSIALADVLYMGNRAGVVAWDADRRSAVFEYEPDFAETGLELAPLQMPLVRGSRPYRFAHLHQSFKGLPGMLADCLPDTFGNVLIDEWLRRQGRPQGDLNPVERLCYQGTRTIGALTFKPSLRGDPEMSRPVEIERLVELASAALTRKEGLNTDLDDEESLNQILRVGTSAGGARAKAVLAWNPETNEVRSGEAEAPEGFEHWILKFDGVSAAADGNRNPKGYGRIEYAYCRMATEAGIEMMPCRLFEEGGKAHFMTRRFDRAGAEGRIHFASLHGLAHLSFCNPGEHSHGYEDAFDALDRLGLVESRKELFRRAAFNVMACNRDDHVKNHGFLMDGNGEWSLAPAYDVTFAYKEDEAYANAVQQLSVCGKKTEITRQDLVRMGRECGVGTVTALNGIIDEISDAISQWSQFAEEAGVEEERVIRIASVLDRQMGKGSQKI